MESDSQPIEIDIRKQELKGKDIQNEKNEISFPKANTVRLKNQQTRQLQKMANYEEIGVELFWGFNRKKTKEKFFFKNEEKLL